MARVFLHIGGHKTGTSFLQAAFFRNHALLSRHGIHYPRIGPNDAHHALAAPWLGDGGLPPGFFGRAGPDGLWDRILADYARRDGTLFLSAENFSRAHPQRVDPADLARRLAPFEEIRIVYTMRRQAEMLQSLWIQVAKTRRPPTLSGYLKRAFQERLGGGVPIDHHGVYEWLLTGFAPEQIHLFDYAGFATMPGGLLQAFLDLLGSGLSAADLASVPRQMANVSPDPLAIYLASQIHPGAMPPADMVARIETALSDIGRPTTLLRRSEYAKLQSRFRPGNALLVERVQKVQPGFTFTEKDPPADLFYRDDVNAATWARVAAALYTPALPARMQTAGDRLAALWPALRRKLALKRTS